jgi:hypothetical protein
MILSFWALEHWRDELPLVESQEFCWTRQVHASTPESTFGNFIRRAINGQLIKTYSLVTV